MRLLGLWRFHAHRLRLSGLKKKRYYRRDLRVTSNGTESVGVGVLSPSDRYSLQIHNLGHKHFVLFKSCNRNHAIQAQESLTEYTYIPLKGIEDQANCPLEIASIDSEGRHAWAFLAIDDPYHYEKGAYLKCNGVEKTTSGVAICQAKSGLIQSIEFNEKMLVVPGEGCQTPQSFDDKSFEFVMPNRECAYLFGTLSEPHRMHLLLTLGYDEVLIRE